MELEFGRLQSGFLEISEREFPNLEVKHGVYLAVGECMHSQIENNSSFDGSINVIFC